MKFHFLTVLRYCLDGYGHFALCGELNRVADQVDQYLAQASCITDEVRRHLWRDVTEQLQALSMGTQGDHIDSQFDG